MKECVDAIDTTDCLLLVMSIIVCCLFPLPGKLSEFCSPSSEQFRIPLEVSRQKQNIIFVFYFVCARD